MNEAKLTKQSVEALRKRGAFAVKIHGGISQAAGLPDIVGCYRGQFFGIEMKMPGRENTLTARQKKKLKDIASAEGWSAVCCSVDHCLDLLRSIEVTTRE